MSTFDLKKSIGCYLLTSQQCVKSLYEKTYLLLCIIFYILCKEQLRWIDILFFINHESPHIAYRCKVPIPLILVGLAFKLCLLSVPQKNAVSFPILWLLSHLAFSVYSDNGENC